MSYAIRNDGLGWRAVNGPGDVGTDEHYSAEQPEAILPSVSETAMAAIASWEEKQMREMARMLRERYLDEAEALAMQQFGLDPDALYAAGKAPNAATEATAAFHYARLKDIDNSIKAEREKIA